MRSGVLRAGAFTFGLCAAAPSFADDTLPLGWHTEVALGGSLATGNTDHQALDLESKVRYRTEHREDVYRLMGDMARDNGTVTAERAEASGQSNYDISKDKLYIFGFARYSRDRFSGFHYEAELGPGVGYRFVRTDRLTFAVEFAPGYRHGELRGTGRGDDQIFARGTASLDYKLSDSAKLTNELVFTGDSERIKTEDTLAVTSTLIRDIAMRLSVNARYNSNPPLAIKKTDTLSKVSLVYAF